MRQALVLSMVVTQITLCSAPSNALAWSSVDQMGTRGYWGTHQYLTEKAYQKLKEHPAFRYAKFPALDDIQRWAGANLDKTGKWPFITQGGDGPDGKVNSKFSFHWYNPITQEGNAPQTVRKYFELLNRGLAGESSLRDGLGNESNLARSAAYSAHYLQDMTCPFHVIGRTKNGLSIENFETDDVIGPYGHITPDNWPRIVRDAMNYGDPNADWFDATYFDGSEMDSVSTSSHFLFEAYIPMLVNNSELEKIERKSAVMLRPSSEWKNPNFGMDAEQFAKHMAKQTRGRIGSKTSPGPLWFDTASMNRKLVIPYEDLYRAVQATYTLWRAAFSALWLNSEDIVFEKMPGYQKNRFAAHIKVKNLDLASDVRDVKVSFDFGTARGEKTIALIKKNDAEIITVENIGNVTPENHGKTLVITVSGNYDSSPDLGKAHFEFDAGVLTSKNWKMIKMADELAYDDIPRLDKVKQRLRGRSDQFKFLETETGLPRNEDESEIVKKQDPPPGVYVSPEEEITLVHTGSFYREVPIVVGMPKDKAEEELRKAGFFSEISVSYDLFDEKTGRQSGIVVGQSPRSTRPYPLDCSLGFIVSRGMHEPAPSRGEETIAAAGSIAPSDATAEGWGDTGRGIEQTSQNPPALNSVTGNTVAAGSGDGLDNDWDGMIDEPDEINSPMTNVDTPAPGQSSPPALPVPVQTYYPDSLQNSAPDYQEPVIFQPLPDPYTEKQLRMQQGMKALNALGGMLGQMNQTMNANNQASPFQAPIGNASVGAFMSGNNNEDTQQMLRQMLPALPGSSGTQTYATPSLPVYSQPETAGPGISSNSQSANRRRPPPLSAPSELILLEQRPD